jgi:predicted pyridoxine 5'-phosphate oxidase superfamily flavin-nucleotide-binding protein
MRPLQEDGSVWHQGELSVQKQAGVLQEARRMQDGIHPTIPDPFRRFIAAQRFASLGTVDADQRVWASLCIGEPGFAQSPDRFSVRIDAASVGDLARINVRANRDAGVVVIDFGSRRRIRLNGEGEILDDGTLLLKTKQVYANCPRYIQQRTVALDSTSGVEAAASISVETSRLSVKQQQLIRAADTFFIASAHPEFGVDVSHRGGNPGFVHVENDKRLIWPDYDGNKMFNTLGNIAVNPRVGLLFPDFATGNITQLTGRATIDWSSAEVAQLPGAQRLVAFDINAVIQTADPRVQRYQFESYSPYNPA